MIAKQFAFAGLAAAGNLASGSGGGNTGVPLGPVDDWAGLAAIQPNDGALAGVESLGLGNANGIAIYSGTEWQLYSGIFDSVADLNAFAEPIMTGAVASVEETGDNNENGVRYIYEGSWVRTAALTLGFAWALTTIFDADPSGVGASQEGDYGIFTPAGGVPITLRKKTVTIAAGAGGGTVVMWVPPVAYSGTNLVIDSYAVGTESDAQLSAQALPVTETNTGTVSATGGYIRLDAPSVGSGSSIAQLTSPVLTGAKKWCVFAKVRGSVSSLNAAAGLFQTSAETATQYSLAAGAGIGTSVTQLYWTSTWVNASTTFTLRGGGSALPAVTPWFVVVMCNDTANNGVVIETRVDGTLYSTYRRNADSATNASNYTATPLAVGGVGVSGRLELQDYYRLTWD